MKRLALGLLLAVAACENGGGYSPDNPPPMGTNPFQVWTPPPAQPMPTQTYIMPSGRMMNCTTYGTVTSCY
jgi:hypothetical protein